MTAGLPRARTAVCVFLVLLCRETCPLLSAFLTLWWYLCFYEGILIVPSHGLPCMLCISVTFALPFALLPPTPLESPPSSPSTSRGLREACA